MDGMEFVCSTGICNSIYLDGLGEALRLRCWERGRDQERDWVSWWVGSVLHGAWSGYEVGRVGMHRVGLKSGVHFESSEMVF